MKVSVEHRDDVMVATIDGAVYELSREITGGQFMDLRKKSIKPMLAEDGSQTGSVRVDPIEFDLWNLFHRLVNPKMTDKEILALPRSIYQSLTLLAGRMDTDEAKGVADFLRENSSIFQELSSISELSSNSPPDTTEVTSE
ncbi:hypothetical protein LCGC14_0448680 [marine sediment metagenome]|uniref:Uncharacterized protein n=1 Tax=marine sediment metagenome TaxID=412755 RepID=A0A0F9T1I4_9ZZZZ